MANTVGALIKEARKGAGLTQEQLALQLNNVTAGDISKAERGEKELSQSVLKQIAKITGVTQASLVNAAKESTYGESTAAKPAAAKPAAAAKKTASATGKTASAAKTSSSAAKNAIELTAAEKKLVELYRAADSDTKKAAVSLLKGEKDELISFMLGGLLNGDGKSEGGLLGSLLGGDGKNGIGSLLGGAAGLLGKK